MHKSNIDYAELLTKLRSRGYLKAEPTYKPAALDNSLIDTPLPNESETNTVVQLIKEGYAKPPPLINKPQLPLRGKISTRGGYALKRTDIPPMLDDFLKANQVRTIFVVQGGNRHITRYIEGKQQSRARDIKLVCLSKATLATILLTILDTKDLFVPLSADQASRILSALSNMSDAEITLLHKKSKQLIGKKFTSTFVCQENLSILLQLFCDYTIKTPFTYPTDDSKLFEEFNNMHDIIEQDIIEIPHMDIVRILLERTDLRRLFLKDERIIFIDDLFYRGRTLFTLACILKAFGIDPFKAHLYTLCADRMSHNLRSDYITVLNKNVLYPFENSMRSERGYWQRAHGRFIFVDLEKFWQYLAITVDTSISMEIYETWQILLEELWIQLPPNKLTKKMTYALLWYLVFHKAYELPIDIASLTDQRGEGIGYCVPYARIIDNFISQEESVDKRLAFKNDIRQAVSDIWDINEKDSSVFKKLVSYYRRYANAIDYEGLNFIFDIYDYGI